MADLRGAEPVLSRRTLQRRVRRRLPAAGRLRLEQPRLRPGLRECRRPRRRHRRWRADPLRRESARRSLLGGARRRPGLLRRRHLVLPQAVPAAGGLRHQRVRLPDRLRRRDLHLGAQRQRRSRPSRRNADRRNRGVPNMGIDHPGIVFASPAFADSEAGSRTGPRHLRHRARSSTRPWSQFLTCQPICPPGTTP